MSNLKRQVLDMEVLDSVKDLMQERFGEMLEYYIEDSAMYFSAIKESCENDDVESAIRPAHTLKSSSLQMGAIRLGKISEQIELSAKASFDNGRNVDEIKNILPALDKEYNAACQAIKALMV